MFQKIFLYIFSFFLFFSSVYAATNSYQEYNSQFPWSYEVYETVGSSYTDLKVPPKFNNAGDTGSSLIGDVNYNVVSSKGRYFRFVNNDNYIIKMGGVDLFYSSDCSAFGHCTSPTVDFTKYRSPNELSSSKCVVNPSLIAGNYEQVKLTPNLKPLQTTSGTLITNAETVIPHLLESNYYMKTRVWVEIYDSSGNQISTHGGDPNYYPLDTLDHVDESYTYAGQTYPSYALVKDNAQTTQIQFDLPSESELLASHGSDTYTFEYHVLPLDGKCDLDSNGDISLATERVYDSSFTYTLTPSYPTPTATIISPSSPAYEDGSFTLSWTSSDASSCSLTDSSGLGRGSGLSGSELISLGTLSETYTLTCTGLGGTATDTLTVYLDSDLDGVPNDDGVNQDKCPTRAWDEAGASATTGADFSGCPHLFTLEEGTTCSGDISFREDISQVSCPALSPWYNRFSQLDHRNSPSPTSVGTSLDKSWGGFSLSLNLQSNVFDEGYYRCLDHSGGFGGSFDIEGSCQIQFNGADQCELFESGTPTGRFIAHGFTLTRFSNERFEYGRTLPGLALGLERQDFTCSFGVPIEVGAFVYDEFRVEPEDYRDIRTSGGLRELDDGRTHSKIKKNNTDGSFFFPRPDGSTFSVSVPSEDPNYEIQIFKNGVNVRNDTIEPEIIALKLHTITRTVRDRALAEEKIENSYNLMTRFDIVKNLTYDPVRDVTNVKIHLRNIPGSDQTNLTVYQVIDKDLASDFDSDITFLSDGGGEKIVLDKDPVIGWYFNESEDDETVEYELPGENEGGTIIITQEPILFNEGEIIVNYREGSDSCVFGEASLFEVDNLEDAEVYSVGSGKYYTVCVAHLNVSLSEGVGAINQHLFTYNYGGNLSIDDSFGNSSVDLYATGNSSPIYWDMIISNDNPDGTYSCLGSITNEENSSFGDCGYTNKRIWLHLGEDTIAPTTQVEVPYLAHTVDVILNATDNTGGSGVENTYYCLSDSTGCTNFTTYMGSFTETCPNDFGCTKEMRFYSRDIEGNVENVQDYTLRIIDRGSACQSDCTSRPSPNRFLKECRNLNGCEYYDIGGDDGYATSLLCDFLTEGSHVKINSTHEIMCPNGPTRPLRFTGFDLSFNNGDCDNVISIPFPIFVEGEPVTMRVISCER